MPLGGFPTPGKPTPAPPVHSVVARQPAIRADDRTLECAVLFLDVVRYSEQPFAVQLDIKRRINAAVREATRHLDLGDRILLDTGDGVAISFLTGPEDALFVGLSLRQSLGAPAQGRPVAIRTGINFGRVSVLRDLNGQPSVIGDGINMAERVMSFANPGQLLVSRAFHRVITSLSEDYAAMFAYCGARTDKHVREHELYEFAAPLARMGQIELPRFIPPRQQPLSNLPAEPISVAPRIPAVRKTALWLTCTVLLVIGALAAAALTRRAAPQGESIAPAALALAPASERGADRPGKGVAAKQKQVVPSATLSFVVAPWGEVVVDGQSYGASPPLTHLPLPAGEHQIEIRNGVSDSYRSVVRVAPNQTLRIQHRFRDLPPAQ